MQSAKPAANNYYRHYYYYLFVSIGVGLQISGSNWDIMWHGLELVETFFTPPHSVIYSGVALSVIFSFGIFRSIWPRTERSTEKNNDDSLSISNLQNSLSLSFRYATLPFPLKLVTVGSIMQLSAGPFDFWWHLQFGFDGLLSPPHSILATGMLLSALGALIGIYYNYNTRLKRGKKDDTATLVSSLSLAVTFSVLLMVAVGMVFLFTLPFSKGQYFDFNPNPTVAIVVASISIPFLTGLIFYTVARIARMPFMITSIIAIFMLMQSTTTIVSNPLFVGQLPLYLLNILPALALDVMLVQHCKDGKTIITGHNDGHYRRLSFFLRPRLSFSASKNRALISSVTISVFFIALFYPWSIDLYKHYFGILENSPENDQAFRQTLLTVILPTVVPAAALISAAAGFIMSRWMKKG